MRGSESAPPVADEADEERAVSPGLKSLKQVWAAAQRFSLIKRFYKVVRERSDT